METRHEQQDSTNPQRKGLSDIIREGKSESLNRAKDALKRRLMQTLMQQVLDEMEQDADEVAQQAMEQLQDEDDVLADLKEQLKTQLLAQIMEEAIAEIDEEVAGGEDGAEGDPADDASDDASGMALFGESTHDEETFAEPGEADAEPTGGALDAEEPSEESGEDEEFADEFESAEDEERPEASADTAWTWNEPATPAEEEDADDDPELEESPVEPFGDQLDDAPPAEDDTLPEVEPSAPVEVDLEAAEPDDDPVADPETLDDDDTILSPEIEEDDATPRMDLDAPQDATTEDADAAYLDDAFNEWADPGEESVDDDFLKHDFSGSEASAQPTGGDTAPFKDIDEFDSALAFDDEVPPVEDSDAEGDDVPDPTSAFSLKEYEVADFSPDWGEEGSADDPETGVETHPAVDEPVAWEETFHEPAVAEEDGLAYYVYGIVASDQDLPDEAFPQGGIDEDYPIFIVQEGGLRALVSRVPAETYEPQALQERMDQDAWAQSHVRRHEHILEQLMQYSALVPMQFGTVYPSEIALRDMLRDQQATFSETLGRLEGTQEWSLTIRCDVELLRREVMEDSTKVQDLLQDMRSKPRGVAQFIKKKMVVAIHDEVQERQEDCVDSSHEAISNFAEDVRVKTTLDDEDDAAPVHAASYLVRKPDEGDFMGEVERLRGIYGHQGFTYEVSGPWPPYSFAESPLTPSAALETEDADSLDA